MHVQNVENKLLFLLLNMQICKILITDVVLA